MELQTKALYNYLRFAHAEDPSIPCEGWQIENLRTESLESLFERLKKKGIFLDSHSFAHFAEECDSPESLAELLLADLEEPELYDRLYLVLFELWRRLLPERQSLSVFCDELDHQIWLFDNDKLDSDEPIQDAIANLIEILEEHVDAGGKPAEVFASIGRFSAQDLYSFLVDFISELLDEGNELYATELIEHFMPYVHDDGWFAFLRIRLMALSDPVKANQQLASLFENKKAITLDFLIEALHFIAIYGEKPLFLRAVHLAIPLLETGEEFALLLTLSIDYFRRRDREDLELAASKILQKAGASFSPKGVQAFKQLLEHSLKE